MRTDYIYAFSPATAIQDGIIYDFFFFFHLFLRQMLLLSTNSFLMPRSTLPQCACYHAPYNWEWKKFGCTAPVVGSESSDVNLVFSRYKFDLCIEWKKKKKMILGEIKSYFGHNLDYSIWYDSPSFSILWYIFNSFKITLLNGFM